MEAFTDTVNVSCNVMVFHVVDEVANHFSDIFLVDYVSDPGLDSSRGDEFEAVSQCSFASGSSVSPIADTNVGEGACRSAGSTNNLASSAASTISNFR